MVSSTTADEGIKAKTHLTFSIVQLSFFGVLFVSLVLLYGFTYFSLRCQLEQLRTDVDKLKAVHSLTLKPAAAAGFPGDDRNGDESSSVQLRRRRRSKIEQATNESASSNDTSDQAESEDDASGEITDQEYRGIWMGTYSRVPVSKRFVITMIRPLYAMLCYL